MSRLEFGVEFDDFDSFGPELRTERNKRRRRRQRSGNGAPKQTSPQVKTQPIIFNPNSIATPEDFEGRDSYQDSRYKELEKSGRLTVEWRRYGKNRGLI